MPFVYDKFIENMNDTFSYPMKLFVNGKYNLIDALKISEQIYEWVWYNKV